jgi:hypothetical protein
MASPLSGSPQFFKYIYKEDEWVDLVRMKHPVLAVLTKDESVATGSVAATGAVGPQTGIVQMWNFATPQSGSFSEQSSLDEQDQLVQGVQLLTQLAQVTGYIRWPGKDLTAAMHSPDQWVKKIKTDNVDGAIKEISNQLSQAIHRAGNGIIGAITAVNTSASTITVTTGTAVQQFTYNMPLISVSTAPIDGSQPTQVANAFARVTGVVQTYVQGNFSITLRLNNTNNFTVGNYICKSGNALGFGPTNPFGNLIGFGNWVPVVAPTPGESFLSAVDRTNDTVRMSGFRMQGEGRTYGEAFVESNAASAAVTGNIPDWILANPIDAAKVVNELGAKVTYEEYKIGKIGFDSCLINTGAGMQRLVHDPDQQVGVLRGMMTDTWKLHHMGPLVGPMDLDGLLLRKVAGSAYAYQMGLVSFPQLTCSDPGANWVLSGMI